jgi:hypothetical protein
MQFDMLTKLGGESLRRPSKIALVVQELQLSNKKSPKPPLLIRLLLLLMMIAVNCLCLTGCTKLIHGSKNKEMNELEEEKEEDHEQETEVAVLTFKQGS